jgi:hypothetical protein
MRRDLEDFPVRFEDCYVCTQPTGGAAMQSRKTFFEQVPIAEAEIVLRQAAALAQELEKHLR